MFCCCRQRPVKKPQSQPQKLQPQIATQSNAHQSIKINVKEPAAHSNTQLFKNFQEEEGPKPLIRRTDSLQYNKSDNQLKEQEIIYSKLQDNRQSNVAIEVNNPSASYYKKDINRQSELVKVYDRNGNPIQIQRKSYKPVQLLNNEEKSPNHLGFRGSLENAGRGTFARSDTYPIEIPQNMKIE